MKELFEKEGRSIFSFRKGDIIIRLKPRVIMQTEYNENLNITTKVEKDYDNSFRKPLEFIAIENNKIYLRDLEECAYYKKRYVHKANVEEYENDWALFVIPDGLKIEECY